MNTSAVPCGSVAAIRPASVPARTSSGDMNGVCSFCATAVGHAITAITIAVVPIVSHRLGSVRSQIHVMPAAARIGRANPNVSTRSGGNHLVTSATGTATTVKVSHASRNRREKPRTCTRPTVASGSVTHGAYRRTFSRNRTR